MNQAQAMLKDIIENKRFDARATFLVFILQTVSAADYSCRLQMKRVNLYPTASSTIRQQSDKVTGKANYSLADFIATKSMWLEDYLGGFTVSIFGAEELSQEYKAKGDDYNCDYGSSP